MLFSKSNCNITTFYFVCQHNKWSFEHSIHYTIHFYLQYNHIWIGWISWDKYFLSWFANVLEYTLCNPSINGIVPRWWIISGNDVFGINLIELTFQLSRIIPTFQHNWNMWVDYFLSEQTYFLNTSFVMPSHTRFLLFGYKTHVFVLIPHLHL